MISKRTWLELIIPELFRRQLGLNLFPLLLHPLQEVGRAEGPVLHVPVEMRGVRPVQHPHVPDVTFFSL